MNLRTFAMSIVAASFAVTTSAQSSTTPATKDPAVKQQRAAAAQAQRTDRIDQLTKELGLTADQGTRLRAADDRRKQSLSELRSNSGGLDRTQQGERNNAIVAAFDEEVKGIMTPEQYTRYKELGRPKAVAPATPGTAPTPAPANE